MLIQTNACMENNMKKITKPDWAVWDIGSTVTKTKGSNWTGQVVGFYSTSLTEKGSVQIYPEAALKGVEGK